MTATPLAATFFQRDTRDVARALLGKLLVSEVDGAAAGGLITETEAYLGTGDPGSHAATKGITERNRVMYGPPGFVYVYFCYGCHHMLNLVTESEGVAGAVLVRALEPRMGIELMSRRRGRSDLRELTTGPGKVTEALGLDLADNGVALGAGRLDVFEAPGETGPVAVSGRIGLNDGHESLLRFYVERSEFVSGIKPGRRPVRT